MKMLNWKVAARNDFQVTTGSSKYLKRFLPPDEMERFQRIFPDGRYEDIWEKLFLMYDYFSENAQYVALRLGFPFDRKETDRVRHFYPGEGWRIRESPLPSEKDALQNFILQRAFSL